LRTVSAERECEHLSARREELDLKLAIDDGVGLAKELIETSPSR
jgi:hypothetical protein